MGDNDSLVSDAAELRKRAEIVFLEKAPRTPEYQNPLTPQAARRILHELRVHQIQLEMQNEELRQAYLELDIARGSYLDLYDFAPVGYLTLNDKNQISRANLTAATQFRTPRSALLKLPISNFIFRDDQDVFYLFRKEAIENHEPRDCELRMARSDGSQFWALMQLTIARNGDNLAEFRIVLSDITERKRADEHIQRLANFDALTGLPNRVQLGLRANHAISLAQRNHNQLALMFVDLDNFKDINDSLGHSFGDALLVGLADRLKSLLRETDTISRLGGDEFIFLFYGVDAEGASHTAQRMLEVISTPISIEQHDLNMTGSIGIALYPDDGGDLETLLKRADTAMYCAKQEGRHAYRFFAAEMQALSSRHLQVVSALRQALERKQLTVHYQPQISLADGNMVGAEALLRWTHPELGSVSPAEFIPAAEDSGLILPIGEWVLRQAVRQTKLWRQGGLAPFKIAVNLSAGQFRHPNLPSMVTRILEEECLPPECLELELTEGVALHDPKGAIAVMNNLHERGVRMSIDDFGTGYSSLAHLKKFKICKLKIDQSFVHDIGTNPEDRAIVCAIINMARSLGLKTIAEGVETAEQLEFLRENGCDEIQGFYCSKPLTVDEFTEFSHVTGGLILMQEGGHM